MNEKEAIERIIDHMEVHRIGEYPHIKLAEALNMAITALRAPQTTLNGTYVSIEWFNAIKSELDALKAERDALKEKQTVKLDRSQWEGCYSCGDMLKKSRMVKLGRNYCPRCGRPLTEEAWAELERERIRF